ncbi:uncharacterized protein G2W53_042972 [Senna tora]|uniref:Uncharacterized protein n=1 Tax=Senna tora TaxID=362788 RepID=A0A834SI43_9FABA|nr:uncharacterized protein G2W53_042972 [Senna tora]
MRRHQTPRARGEEESIGVKSDNPTARYAPR